MTYKIVDWTGKQLFNKTFKNFDSAFMFIDSINKIRKTELIPPLIPFRFEDDLFEDDYINDLWVIPS